MLGGRGPVWASVADVVEAAEDELDTLVADVADRVMARVRAADGAVPAGLDDALRRAASAGVRDSLARLRAQTEPPEQLLPDLADLARLCATLRFEPTGLTDAWLVGEEMFWDRLQAVAERTLGDTALCWDVIKAARARLRGHSARVSELFRRGCELEFARAAGIDGHSRLGAVMRVLDGQWVDPGALGYDLGGHHVALVADSSASLDAMARRTDRQLLRVQAPDGAIWAWARRAEQDLRDRARRPDLLARLVGRRRRVRRARGRPRRLRRQSSSGA